MRISTGRSGIASRGGCEGAGRPAHGGVAPGSARCIDLGRNEKGLFRRVAFKIPRRSPRNKVDCSVFSGGSSMPKWIVPAPILGVSVSTSRNSTGSDSIRKRCLNT